MCFHDVVTRNGTMKRGIEFPLIPGHEISGIVESVGPDVREFRPGDRVATLQRRHICGHCRYCRDDQETACREREFLGDAGLNGGYAELVCVEQDNVALVLDGVDLASAAIIACTLGTELNAIRDTAELRVGERVLVNGAGGGLGIHGVQLAHIAGAEVIAVTGSPGKVETIRAAGADQVVLFERGEDFSAKVRALTGGEGVDVAVDNVGSPTFEAMRRSLAQRGRWIFIGQLNGDFVRLNPAQLFFRNISILSAQSTTAASSSTASNWCDAAWLKPMVSTELPLERAADAHRMAENAAPTGRILLRPSLAA